MKIKLSVTLLVSLLCYTLCFAQKSASTEHFLKIQPLSIAERHFGWGLGAGYELTSGRKVRYGLSFPINYYHGIFAQIGKPTMPFPDVKSRYATFSPTFNFFPVYSDRFSYGIGMGLQIMYAYGTRAVQAEGINPIPAYVSEHYKAFRWSYFANNQFAFRMGRGNNRFVIDLGIGTPFYNRIPDNNASLIVRFNIGFAFAL